MELGKVGLVISVFVGLSFAASSTELVEENGCYNSEFKLTCNHITSTIGILEATFRPNCENGNGKSNKLCLLLTQHYHEGPTSIMKVIAQSLGNPLKKDEEQAVRDFLEALRSARLKEQEQEEKEVRTSEYRTELNVTELQELAVNETEAAVFVDYIATDRNDKRTLRDSLEKLTNFYLTRLIEDSDYYSLEDSDEDKDVNNRNKRDLRSVTRKINMRKKLNPGSCRDMNRRIGVLSQMEIQKSLRNFSGTELNIRKALNYRCSGKNHCSFIFANDHPYATFWERGTINIKYICMDDFRLNKYCGELLHVGNEIWDNDDHHNTEFHEDDDSGEGPRAEARRQSDENQPHTNLKILSATDASHNKHENKLNFRKLDIQEKPSNDKSKQPKKENVKSAKGEVFSQDFKLLKILTNDVVAPSVTSNAEKVENKKIYEFKKSKEMSNEISNEVELVVPTEKIYTTEKHSLSTGSNLNENNDIDSDESNTKSSHTTDDESNDVSHLFTDIGKSTTAAMTSATTEDVEIIIIDRVDLGRTVLNSPSTTVFEDTVTTEDVAERFSTNSDVEVFNHTSFSELAQRVENDFATSSYEEDYSSSETINPTRRVEYSYQQKTLPSSTLLHGFISNPGYPSFYIGKSNECKWRIRIGKDQTIALTILDLHLRIDVQENCKDSLEIVDELNSKILYRGCAELSRPLQVKSISNSVEITLKTQSKTIYPKRGFLIHYQAVGCVLPPLQSRVELEYHSEDIAKYVCAENHVFPDTSSQQRVLQCINDNWNDTLVNCFHQESFGSGPVHLLHNARLRKEKTMGSNDESFDAVILPLMIVIGLFLINAIVFILIIRYRKRQRQQSLDRELADL